MRLQRPDGQLLDITVPIVLSPQVEQEPWLYETLHALNQLRNDAEAWMFENCDDLPPHSHHADLEILTDMLSVLELPQLPSELLESVLKPIVARVRRRDEVKRQYGLESPVLIPGSVLQWDNECSAVHVPILGGFAWIVAQLTENVPVNESAFLSVENGSWFMRRVLNAKLNQAIAPPAAMSNRWETLRDMIKSGAF